MVDNLNDVRTTQSALSAVPLLLERVGEKQKRDVGHVQSGSRKISHPSSIPLTQHNRHTDYVFYYLFYNLFSL